MCAHVRCDLGPSSVVSCCHRPQGVCVCVLRILNRGSIQHSRIHCAAVFPSPSDRCPTAKDKSPKD